jgi:hypothetical protein
LVRDQSLLGFLRAHRDFRKARLSETESLQFLDARLAVEIVHLFADLSERVACIAIMMCRMNSRQDFSEGSIAVP